MIQLFINGMGVGSGPCYYRHSCVLLFGMNSISACWSSIVCLNYKMSVDWSRKNTWEKYQKICWIVKQNTPRAAAHPLMTLSHLTQSIFRVTLNFSQATPQYWEYGAISIRGPSFILSTHQTFFQVSSYNFFSLTPDIHQSHTPLSNSSCWSEYSDVFLM